MELNMAFSVKRDEIIQVPWFSPAEWYEVYEQIYSNNTPNQTKAYEALLAWKVRMPKLPVGVDCTLSILQVCLKDREWTSKIDAGELPMYCQNDLSLMYSTTIMRFLNHISNIGHTKQRSLFQIARQLKIPEWLVNLRHDAAHGHELPSIEVLRMAINVLLQWLHDEYWAPELRAMEKYYMKEDNLFEEEESEEVFTDLIELWTTVSLYIHAGHKLVSDIPDIQLRATLQELYTYVVGQYNGTSNNEDQCIQIEGHNIKINEEYNLKAARAVILFEISVYLSRNISLLRKHDIICDTLCENVAFLPNSDIMQILMRNKKGNLKRQKKFLPVKMLKFWKDIIILFQNKGMVESLILKLVNVVDNERENKERRLFAAIWINTIAYSFVQLDLAQNISHEYELNDINQKMSAAILNQHIRKHVHSIRPYLRNVLWFDLSTIIPHFLFDIKFLSRLLLNVNEFSVEFIKPICKLVTPSIETKIRQHISNLLRIYVFQKYDNNGDIEKPFTADDICAILTKNGKQTCSKKPPIKDKVTYSVASDETIRNLHWKVAFDTYKWAGCPIGLLPWQANTLKSLEPLKLNTSKQPVSILDSRIVPGIINNKNLRTESRINWDNVLRKKRKIKRKQDKDRVAVRMMNTALEIAKKQN